MITITVLSVPHGKQTASADVPSLRAAQRAEQGVRPKGEKRDRKNLIQLLDSIKQPKQDTLSDQEFEAVIDAFCAGCPDPVQARWLLLDCLDPLSDEELVERALAMPPRT